MHVSNRDAEANFATLLQRAAEGDEIVIVEFGKPIAWLVAVEPGSTRRLGSAPGHFAVPPDFDDPLPESFIAEFES